MKASRNRSLPGGRLAATAVPDLGMGGERCGEPGCHQSRDKAPGIEEEYGRLGIACNNGTEDGDA